MKIFTTLYLLLFSVCTLVANPVVTLYPVPETCSNGNGAITTFVTGGASPYSYVWSNGMTTSGISGLSAGTYSVTVTDAIGATATASAVVSGSPNLLNASLNYVDPTNINHHTWPCNTECNGIVYLDQNQIIGSPPYSLTLETTTNFSIQPTLIGGVPALVNICLQDEYTVRVFDASGCSTLIPMFPPFPLASFDHTLQINPACFGGNNGSAILDFHNLVSGLNNAAMIVNYSGPMSGTAPSGNPIIIDHLLPGNYTLDVHYSMNNTCDTSISITIPDLGFNCGVISGSVYLDTTSNCIADANEPFVPQQLIRFDPGPYYTVTDAAGNFISALPFNTYSATLLSQYPLYPICNVNFLNLTSLNDTISGVMLGDSVNITTDIHPSLTGSEFRPGFQGALYVNLINDSYDLIPYPQVDIYYDTLLTYLNSTLPPVMNTPGFLSFFTGALMPFNRESFHIYFQVPADPGLIGDSITFTANAIANIPEPDTIDNTNSVTFIISGSFDPNDKSVFPARDSQNSFNPAVDEEFIYTIRFQNTGTDTAFNVVIVDTLSAALDPSTFRLLATSHPVLVEFAGQDALLFRFNNILLPDSNVSEPASHGAISFAIEPYRPVIVSSIENRADIYFDFNPPVLTNVVSSVITTVTSTHEITFDNDLTIYPNPSNDEIIVSLKSPISDPHLLRLFNLFGEMVMERPLTSNDQQRLDVYELPSGIYLVTVENQKGEKRTGRMVKH